MGGAMRKANPPYVTGEDRRRKRRYERLRRKRKKMAIRGTMPTIEEGK